MRNQHNLEQMSVKLDFAIATLSLLADNIEGGSDFGEITLANVVYGIQSQIEEVQSLLQDFTLTHERTFRTGTAQKLSRLEAERLTEADNA